MFELLEKFRIEVAEIVILTDFDAPPHQTTVGEFYQILQPFIIEKEDVRNKEHPHFYPTQAELDMLKHKVGTIFVWW